MIARFRPLLAALAVVGCGGDVAEFDKQAWAAERGNYDGVNRRGELVTGLEAAGVRPGARREQVRMLLGEPDGTGPDADTYFLGRTKYGIEYETYTIHYSPAGVVTSAQIERT